MNSRSRSEEDKALLAAIGRQLKAACKARKMTQTDLAVRIGNNNPVHVSQIETGKAHPSLHYVVRMVNGIGVPLEEFFRGVDQEMTQWRTRQTPSELTSSVSTSLPPSTASC